MSFLSNNLNLYKWNKNYNPAHKKLTQLCQTQLEKRYNIPPRESGWFVLYHVTKAIKGLTGIRSNFFGHLR